MQLAKVQVKPLGAVGLKAVIETFSIGSALSPLLPRFVVMIL